MKNCIHRIILIFIIQVFLFNHFLSVGGGPLPSLLIEKLEVYIYFYDLQNNISSRKIFISKNHV